MSRREVIKDGFALIARCERVLKKQKVLRVILGYEWVQESFSNPAVSRM